MISNLGGSGAAVVVVVVSAVADVGVVDEVVVGDEMVVLVGDVDGELSIESLVAQPTNTNTSVSVHHLGAMTSTSTYHHPPPAKGAQEANDPPKTAPVGG